MTVSGLLGTYWPYLSLFFNVMLLVLLFFRGALNQIVIDWVQSKRAKQDLLIELDSQVSNYARAFGDICFYLYLFALKPGLKKSSESFWQNNVKKFEDAKKFISENKLRFTEDLQRMINRLFGESNAEDVLDNPVLFEERSGRVNLIADEIKVYIRKKL